MTALVPVVAVLIVVATSLWVFADARRWAQAGTPVSLRIGSLTIDRPESWALGCLVLWVLFTPIYAVARRS